MTRQVDWTPKYSPPSARPPLVVLGREDNGSPRARLAVPCRTALSVIKRRAREFGCDPGDILGASQAPHVRAARNAVKEDLRRIATADRWRASVVLWATLVVAAATWLVAVIHLRGFAP